jgi:hypothetical protein
MQRMLLVLTRSSGQEAALQKVLREQQDPASVSYHQWLTPQQFGERFGAADHDVQTVTSWLQSYGFQIDHVSNGRSIIEFSGNAAQVQQAFHTEIHKYVVNGKMHWANASDPEIPSALTGVVAGIATLHNFRKKPQLIKSPEVFQKQPEFTGSDGSHALSPADYAVIYNINPLYNAGIDGTGAVIAVVGRSNINTGDIASFRSTFDLSNNQPVIVPNGPPPGNLGGDEEAEAVLDTTWAGAVAPGATVKLVISASTNTTDGVDLSEAYIIDNNLADVMTESFGSCEASYTTAEATAISSLAEQAAAQGITYAVAAGDSGAEGCDDPTETKATGPLSVNLLASTPYTIAVGGTQFNEGGNNAAYWQGSNQANESSAIQYIPENVWNESCVAGQCTAGNSPALWAGGGGASHFFSKPVWQNSVPGIPNDGARDVPDVSLTAAGHDAYLLCLTSFDGTCKPDSTGRISFDGYSGTSAATPSFAGIMALVVQYTGSRQGQADYTLYPMAAISYAQCSTSSSSCFFHDVTSGSNAVPGETGYGTGTAQYQAGPGYDLATGLGSLDVANLVFSWGGGSGTPNTQPSATSIAFGSVYIGLPMTKTLTLMNTGTARAPILEIAVAVRNGSNFSSGSTAGDFSETNTCGVSIAPGVTCQISVTFTPTAASSESASLIVNTETDRTLPLSGNGVTSTSLVASQNATLSFGSQTVLTISDPQKITIANPTGGAVDISTIGFTSGSNGFNQVNNCPAMLEIGQNCTFAVTFAPKLLGSHSFTLGTANSPAIFSGNGTAVADVPLEIVNLLSNKALDVTGASMEDGTPIQQYTLDSLGQQQWVFVALADGTYAIQNALTGKVLDITGASSENGAQIDQWAFTGSGQQHWVLQAGGDLTYSIASTLDGKVLDVTNASLASGALIQQWDPDGSEQQQWQLVPAVNYTIVNSLTGKVLDVQNASTASGAAIQQWDSNGFEQQQWKLVPVEGGFYKILNVLTGKALDVQNASAQNGAAIQQWDYDGFGQQLWNLVLMFDGDYEIQNVLSGKVLDVTNASSADGALIQQWDADGLEQQHWKLVRTN